MERRYSATVLTVILSIALFMDYGVSQGKDDNLIADDAVGKKAVAFTVNDPVSGKDFSLSDFKGSVVFMNWMSPGECKPCEKQVAISKKIIEKYKDKGLKSAAFIYRGDDDRPDLVKKMRERRETYLYELHTTKMAPLSGLCEVEQ